MGEWEKENLHPTLHNEPSTNSKDDQLIATVTCKNCCQEVNSCKCPKKRVPAKPAKDQSPEFLTETTSCTGCDDDGRGWFTGDFCKCKRGRAKFGEWEKENLQPTLHNEPSTNSKDDQLIATVTC